MRNKRGRKEGVKLQEVQVGGKTVRVERGSDAHEVNRARKD